MIYRIMQNRRDRLIGNVVENSQRGGAMIRPEFRKILCDQRGAAVILWSCFMIAIVIYIVIARNVLATPRFARGFSQAESVRIGLWVLALVDFGYYVYWKKRYVSSEAILGEAKSTKVLRALEGHQGPLEERAAAVVSTYVTRKTVLFAIIEAIAVYGLLLALAGHYLSDLYLLSAVSLLLLTVEFPSERSLERLLHKVEGAETAPGTIKTARAPRG
jgi:hypothetical protein